MDVKLPKKQEQEHMASFIISIPKPRQSDSNELDSMRTCHGPCRKRVEELNFNLELVDLVLSKTTSSPPSLLSSPFFLLITFHTSRPYNQPSQWHQQLDLRVPHPQENPINHPQTISRK